MSKIDQKLGPHTPQSHERAAMAEAGADISEVFSLPPLSRTRAVAHVIKVRSAPFSYVADDTPAGDDEE